MAFGRWGFRASGVRGFGVRVEGVHGLGFRAWGYTVGFRRLVPSALRFGSGGLFELAGGFGCGWAEGP